MSDVFYRCPFLHSFGGVEIAPQHVTGDASGSLVALWNPAETFIGPWNAGLGEDQFRTRGGVMLLLLILILLLVGGGGGYYGYSRWGTGGGMGIFGLVLIILLIYYLVGGAPVVRP
jgi:hypothetical protein